MNQTLSLVEQLKHLEHLQEIDLKIDALKKNQISLPASLRTIDESLSKMKIAFEIKKAQVAEIDKARRQTQAALDLNHDRLTRSNTKLETVQNSQEFQAVNKEIEQLKKLNASLDEQNKKSLVEIESARAESEKLEGQFQKLQEERNTHAAELSGQDDKFKSDIAELMKERSKFSVHVETRILSQYDRIRVARAGIGIVPAVAGRCKGCNMMVPPQLYNEIQRGNHLHSCPSCNRLLYLPQIPQAVTDEKLASSAEVKA